MVTLRRAGGTGCAEDSLRREKHLQRAPPVPLLALPPPATGTAAKGAEHSGSAVTQVQHRAADLPASADSPPCAAPELPPRAPTQLQGPVQQPRAQQAAAAQSGSDPLAVRNCHPHATGTTHACPARRQTRAPAELGASTVSWCLPTHLAADKHCPALEQGTSPLGNCC